MANQSDDSPEWHYLDPEELRTELAAVWPDALPRPDRAKVSVDGLTWIYRFDRATMKRPATLQTPGA